jgi:CRP/FNR family transcriptional regulator, cyclic AMP receptor protein
MASLLELVANQPSRTLAQDEILMAQGEDGGDLFVLERGKLSIERDGVELATLSIPGTVVGEMSVLTGTRHTATVRAAADTRVKMVRDAIKVLETDPKLTLRLAALVASRLEATSGELVAMQHDTALKSAQGVFSRLASALHISPR